jgi:hypothetical protein
MPTDSASLSIACLCGCGRARGRKRGLHDSCYDRARRRVAAGVTTWAALESAGLALAANRYWQRTGKRP